MPVLPFEPDTFETKNEIDEISLKLLVSADHS